MRKTGKKVPCATCGIAVYIPRWRLKRLEKNHFCNHQCFAQFKTTFNKTGQPAIEKNCEVCGELFKVKQSSLKQGKGKTCSFECSKVSISKSLTGRKNPKHSEFMRGKKYNYKEDRSQLSKKIPRRNMRYLIWRQMVLQRDKRQCKLKDTECIGKLEVHHIVPFRESEELRYNVDNGITVCHHHHPRGKEKEEDYKQYLLMIVDLTKMGYEIHR